MSLLIRYIVKGLGWELGKTAAKEAIEALREEGRDAQADERARAEVEAKARREAERTAAKEAKRRAAEAKQRERDVERELKELKKRVDRG